MGPDCAADSQGALLECAPGWSPKQTDGGLTSHRPIGSRGGSHGVAKKSYGKTFILWAERRRSSPASAVGGSVGGKTRAKPDRRKSHAQRKQEWERERDTEKERELYREKRRQGILARFRKAKWIKDTQKDMIKERILNREKLNAEKRKLGSMRFANKILQQIVRAMIYNVEGINQLNKRQEIEEYAYQQGVSIALCTETQHPHTSEEGGTARLDTEGKEVRGKYKWYFSSGKDQTTVEKAEK